MAATMTTTSAEEAVERAKAIAARLSGETPATTTTATITSKRKRWGVTPDEEHNKPPEAVDANEVLPGLATAVKRLKDSSAATDASSSPASTLQQRRVWISTSSKPAAHFVAYLSDLLDELRNNEVNVLLQLKGRGSSKDPPVPGMPEEPLHVFLQGPAAWMAQTEPQVDQLVQEAEEAAPLAEFETTDAPAAAHAAAGATTTETDNDYNNSINSEAIVAINQVISTQTQPSLSSSSSVYRPASVAQLIGQALVPNATIADFSSSGELLEEKISIPNGVVGFIIGRGGETIASLQGKTGAKVQIQKEHEVQPGRQGQRIITLTAHSKEAIDACRELIENMVQDRIRINNSGNSNNNNNGKDGMNKGKSHITPQEQKVQEAVSLGHCLVQILVPDADVGLIIGKMGSTIQSIQERSGGASIQIPPHGDPENPTTRTVSITHPTEQGALIAKQIIEDILKSKPNFSNNNNNQQQQHQGGPQLTIQVTIPDKDVGLCIGRQGCVIREMQHKTNTRIQIPSQPTPGLSYRIATVIGTQDGCASAEQLIQRIIVEQSSACVMTGTPYQHGQLAAGGMMMPMSPGGQPQYYQQQQQQQQQGAYYGQAGAAAGGQEYSAEWAAYYAAQAAAQQQQQQMQQQEYHQSNNNATATAAATTATTGSQPAADAYYEQFFRYAYYYGEDSARAYYGAWSPAVGTPNPYGTNPSGITAAPAGGAAAAGAAATPASNVAAVRDSSVRSVSNLPAWMTKGDS